MAAKTDGGESRGLIISLVFFVLLSIVLGVLVYLAYGDKDEAEKKAAAAKKDAEKAEDERNFYRFTTAQVLEYAGKLPASDRKLLQSRADFDGGKIGKNVQGGSTLVTLIKEMGSRNDRDWRNGRANNPYSAEVARLRQENEGLQAQLAAKTEAAKQADSRATASKQALDEEQLTNKQNIEKNNQKIVKEKEQEIYDRIMKREQQINTVTERNTQLQTQVAQLEADKRKADQAAAAADKRYTSLLKAQTRKQNVEQSIRQLGEIYSIDHSGNTVIVQFPSTRNLPNRQTFSVRGVGKDGETLRDAKATLTVTKVLGNRLANARLTWVKDRLKDPVMKGDKLYTIGWDPTASRHVAITGIIETTGDRDKVTRLKTNSAEAARAIADFRRTLEKQGVVVDAWTDPRTGKVNGEITLDTDFLIVGYVPGGGGTRIGGGSKPDKSGGKTDPAQVMRQMVDDAIRHGVTIVSLRKYLQVGGNIPTVGDTGEVLDVPPQAKGGRKEK